MYDTIISVENLLEAWKGFLKGKRNKRDVQEFQYRLSDNIFALHHDLKDKAYVHGGYHAFHISDPKPRSIHKATVKDRLLHHAIYRQLYPFFDRIFIFDSYSCRRDKGTHRAINRFRQFARASSKNNRTSVWILKCDIRKFFATIDHSVLFGIVGNYITDKDVLWLIQNVADSFQSTQVGKGLPLGNLTSQLLVNVYMNEFDQFVKHTLKAKYYIRYADDFVVFSEDKKWLEDILLEMTCFLKLRLKLSLHPDKVFIKTLASGVDFLGWVHFFDHRVLRTVTKKRMYKKVTNRAQLGTLTSYLGMLRHGNAKRLEAKIKLLGKEINKSRESCTAPHSTLQ